MNLIDEQAILIGGYKIRYFRYEGKLLFVAKDLGDYLGYPIVDEALRKTVSRSNVLLAHFKSSNQGRGQNVLTVDGVIELLTKSKMDNVNILRQSLEQSGLIRTTEPIAETVKVLQTCVGRIRALESKPLFFAKDVMSAYGLQASLFKKMFINIIRLNCGEAKLTMLADEQNLRTLVACSDKDNADQIPSIIFTAWKQTHVIDEGLNLSSIRAFHIPNYMLSNAGLPIDNPTPNPQQCKQGSYIAPLNTSNIWFVGRDVATVVSYVDTKSAVRDNVSNSNKIKGVIHTDTSKKSVNLINFEGVKELVYKSRTAKAFQFRHVLESGEWNPSPIGEIISLVCTYNGVSIEHQTANNSITPAVSGRAYGTPTNSSSKVDIIQSTTKDTSDLTAHTQSIYEAATPPVTAQSDSDTQISRHATGMPISASTNKKNHLVSATTQIIRTPIKLTDNVLSNLDIYLSNCYIKTNRINTPWGQIRTIEFETDVWYVLVDICNLLEIKNSRTVTDNVLTYFSDIDTILAPRHLKRRGVISPDYTKIPRSLVSNQYKNTLQKGIEGEEITIVSMKGLLKIVCSSRKSMAKEFREYFLNHLPIVNQQTTDTIYLTEQIKTLSEQIKTLTNLQNQILTSNQTNQSLAEIQQTLKDNTPNSANEMVMPPSQIQIIRTPIKIYNEDTTANTETHQYKIYSNKLGVLRGVSLNKVIWLVATDVAKALKYHSSPMAVDKYLDYSTTLEVQILNGNGKVISVSVTNELGILNLMLYSNAQNKLEIISYLYRIMKGTFNDTDTIVECRQFPNYGIIRLTYKNGEYWYCISDVCSILDLQPQTTIRRILSDNVVRDSNNVVNSSNSMGTSSDDIIRIPLINATGKIDNMYFTNQKGLYQITKVSRKPLAKSLYQYFLSRMYSNFIQNTNQPVSHLDTTLQHIQQNLISLTETITQSQKTTNAINDIKQTLEDNTIQVTKLISTVSTTALAYRFNFKVPQFYKWLIYKGLVYRDIITRNYMPTERAIQLGLAVIKSSSHSPYVHWLIEPMQAYISQCMSDIGNFNDEWLKATEGKSPY